MCTVCAFGWVDGGLCSVQERRQKVAAEIAVQTCEKAEHS